MIAVAVAVCTADDAGGSIGRQQAGDIRILPPALHRVERRVGGIERPTGIEIVDLTGNGHRADDIVIDVAMAFETYFIKIS